MPSQLNSTSSVRTHVATILSKLESTPKKRNVNSTATDLPSNLSTMTSDHREPVGATPNAHVEDWEPKPMHYLEQALLHVPLIGNAAWTTICHIPMPWLAHPTSIGALLLCVSLPDVPCCAEQQLPPTPRYWLRKHWGVVHCPHWLALVCLL